MVEDVNPIRFIDSPIGNSINSPGNEIMIVEFDLESGLALQTGTTYLGSAHDD